MDNQGKKKLQIIDAATKRFAHFGTAKTTMAEIAKDLSISKASLYYYFPDKMHLVVAVLQRIVDAVMVAVDEELFNKRNLEEAIHFLLDLRRQFLLEHYHLLEMLSGTLVEMPAELEEISRKAHQADINVMGKLLQWANDKGEIQVAGIEELAEIICNAMEGMRFSILKERKKIILPSKSKFDEIFRKQKKLSDLIIKGLKTIEQ